MSVVLLRKVTWQKMNRDIQRNRMLRYLLGDLPESEGGSVEDECLTDDEKFEQMWEVENDLIERYVRGSLASKARERFERHYLASPVHRRRVEVARNVIEKAETLGDLILTLAAVNPTCKPDEINDYYFRVIRQ